MPSRFINGAYYDEFLTREVGAVPDFVIAGLSVPTHDEVNIAYANNMISTLTYKNSGATVATVTLTFDDNNKLTNIVKAVP